MTEINKSESVPFSADQMYALVNDIEAYPEFLPWCKSSCIYNQSEEQLSASVDIAVGKIRHSFTTLNRMTPGRKIEMQLEKGPFKYLTGTWCFTPKNGEICDVTLHMQFEFKNKLLKLALERAFNKIMSTMVESFINRAQDIYG